MTTPWNVIKVFTCSLVIFSKYSECSLASVKLGKNSKEKEEGNANEEYNISIPVVFKHAGIEPTGSSNIVHLDDHILKSFQELQMKAGVQFNPRVPPPPPPPPSGPPRDPRPPVGISRIFAPLPEVRLNPGAYVPAQPHRGATSTPPFNFPPPYQGFSNFQQQIVPQQRNAPHAASGDLRLHSSKKTVPLSNKIKKLQREKYANKVGEQQPEKGANKIGKLQPEKDEDNGKLLQREKEANKIGKLQPEKNEDKVGKLRQEKDANKIGKLQPEKNEDKVGKLRQEKDASIIGKLQPEKNEDKIGKLQKEKNASRLKYNLSLEKGRGNSSNRRNSE